MYITYNEINYPCTCYPSKTMIYRGLPDDFPVPVSGEIALCADDGFVMRVDVAEDYLRQTFECGVLMLTNIPEQEPTGPAESGPALEERVADLEDALALTDETAIELYEAMMAQEEINTAQDDALIELYEMIGG